MKTISNIADSRTQQILRDIEVFLLDLDGTLYLGDRWIPGAKEFLGWLRENDRHFLILTNNSSKSPAAYQQKLESMDVRIPLERFFTSGDATIFALERKYPRARIFVAGTSDLKQMFRQSGFTVVNRDPEVVVLGFDTRVTYDTLRKTCDFIRAGLPYFATHPDLNCPVEGGDIPDTGAFIALIAASTGKQPDEICGKPFPAMVEAICEKLECSPEKMAMVGDRLNTDIALGSAGIRTVLVLSGETALDDLKTSSWQPDIIFESVADLFGSLKAMGK